MHWYFDVMKKYSAFQGRASRQEYLMFAASNLIIALVLGTLLGFVLQLAGMASKSSEAANVFTLVYEVVVFVPSMALAVRRMHDTDHRGWWMLVPIFNFGLIFSRGRQGENRFGPAPRLLDPSSVLPEPVARRGW